MVILLPAVSHLLCTNAIAKRFGLLPEAETMLPRLLFQLGRAHRGVAEGTFPGSIISLALSVVLPNAWIIYTPSMCALQIK